MGSDIKKEALSGMIWSGVQKYSKMIIQFISGIVLARLLTPYDYGCIGMLSIFMVLANSIIDGGFGSALIQKKNPTQEDYSTIFYWNLIISVVMYVALYIAAPSIAGFYNIEVLSDVLRVQAVVLIINAFTLVQSNQLRKHLNFKLISIVTVLTSIVSLIVTIVMAYKGFGVWSLVTQNILVSLIPAVIYWFYVRWRPIWIFSWKSFKELFSFGFYMFLTHLLNNFSGQVQGLLIGKFYNPATMGYYSKARSTEMMAATSISSVITQVTYPLYAKLQDNINSLMILIRKLSMVISYLTLPLMIILVMTAKPIFLLLYTEKWLPCVPYFQILCFAGMANCLIAVTSQTISAIGKSKVMFICTLVKRLVGLGAIIGGMVLFGIKGLLAGVLINTYFAYFVTVFLVSKYIGYKWYRQLLDLAPGAVVAIVSAAISYFVIGSLNLQIYVDAVLKSVMFVTLYIAISRIFKLEAYSMVYSIIPQKFRFWEKK